MLVNKTNFSTNRFQYLLSLYLKRNQIISALSSSRKQLDSTMKNLIASKQYKKALNLFDQQTESCSNFTINMAIKACTNIHDYKRGIIIEQKLSQNSLNDPYIQTSLIHLYMQCHQVDNANRLFTSVVNKSNAMYAAMFKGYINNRMPEKVLDVFEHMHLIPNNITYTIIFNACAQLSNNQAKKIGNEALRQMLNNNQYDNITLTSVIHMLMKFGNIERAESIFKLIKNEDIITYGTMMKGYVENQMSEKALDLFEQINLVPRGSTYTIVFNACSQLVNDRAITIGETLLEKMPDSYNNNNIVLTSAIHMLMKFRNVKRAEAIFELIKKKDIIAYGAVMKGYVENEMSEKALDLFEQINLDPNEIIYTIVFKACAEVLNDQARRIGSEALHQILNNHSNNNILLNSAIHMLMRFGDVERAESIFESIKIKDIITYGAMMKIYVENQMSEKALKLFEEMNEDPNEIIYTIVFNACAQVLNDQARKIGNKALHQMLKNHSNNNNIVLTSAIHMLMKFDDVKSAKSIFESIKNKDNITFGTLMNGYNINKQPLKCLQIFEEMKQHGVVPNLITYNILINACAQIGMLSRCLSIVNQIPLHIQNEQQIQNSLIDMWGKAGSINKAQNVFDSTSNRDLITYNTMINAYGRNGMGLEAIKLYREMPNNLRDDISHVCVLNACSHAGLLNEARIIFNEILIKTTQIVTVMVDCLSRLFLFKEAQNLIDNYETFNSPHIVMYMAMLAGIRNNRDHILSEKLYSRMKHLFTNQKQVLTSGAILLSNIYSSVGDYEKAKNIRSNEITEVGLKKQIGLAWTEVNNELVQFKAHDNSHRKYEQIDEQLKRMASELIEHGHTFDSSWVTRSMNADETVESILCGHSEKLAIAFNFIQQPPPSFIQVTNNLRICGDCHQAIKLIAKIRRCDIVIRDANRIHHFQQNGQCSCQDHF